MTFSRVYSAVLASACLNICLWAAPAAHGQQGVMGENFPGVQKALTPEQYNGTGLDKLTPDQRAKLDEYLRGYFTGASQRVADKASKIAAATAVDEAVKTHKVQPPEVIQSRIIGSVNGWKSGKVFTLENGQRWKVTEEDRYFRAIENPDIIIYRDFLSYKMVINGAGTTRVVRVGQ